MKTAIFSLSIVALLFASTVSHAQKSPTELQADTLLDKAMRQGTVQAKQDLATQAEKLYIQVAADLKNQIQKAKDEKEARELKYKLGVVLMSQLRTYVDESRDEINRKIAVTIDEARKVFEELDTKEKVTSPLAYKAKAWLFKCTEKAATGLSSKYLKDVTGTKSKDAEEAQALIRYFRLGYNAKSAKNPTELDLIRGIIKDGEDWVKSYPAYVKTPLGHSVRFELGNAYLSEAQLFKQERKEMDDFVAESDRKIKEAKDMKPAKAVDVKTVLGADDYAKYQAVKKKILAGEKDFKLQPERYGKAQAIFKSLIDGENEYAERSKGLDLFISRITNADKSATDLSTFELCYLRAQEEMEKVGKISAQIRDIGNPDEKKTLEKNRKTLFRAIAQTLNRGIALADSKTPVNDVEDARYDLLISYMGMQDNYRVAVAGENMARVKPLSKKGAQAAGYAIQAYMDIVSADKSEDNRNRMRDLILFVLSPEAQQAWAKEPVTGVARFHLAMLYLSEGNLEAGIDNLQKVPRDFPAYIYAQCKLVFVALDARDRAKNAEEKKKLTELARKTANALPPLPKDIDASSANLYFHARMEETKFLYAEAGESTRKNDTVQARKLFQQMATLVAQLSKELQGVPAVSGERLEQLHYYMGTMQKYSTLGLADFEYRGGAYDQVLALTAPTVEAVRQQAAKGGVVRLKDFQVTGEILGLALRANVQKGKIDEAKQLLKILENLKGLEDNLLVDSTGVLRNLVVELEVQIRDLQKAGDREKLKKTVGNFSEFLDALVKQSEKKTLEKNDIFFLAKCYDSLEQHEKAAKLYALYPAPKFLNVIKKSDKDKFSDEDEKELQAYWYTQVQQARQLRLSKKLNEAKKILDALQEHKNARQQLFAEREQNHILEDNGLYGTAITHWSQFMGNPNLKKSLASDPKIREIYFDAYYHLTYCWYKYSQTDKVKKAGKDAQFLEKAADYIVRLETAPTKDGWQLVEHKFRDLLRTEPLLDQAYKKKKGG